MACLPGLDPTLRPACWSSSARARNAYHKLHPEGAAASALVRNLNKPALNQVGHDRPNNATVVSGVSYGAAGQLTSMTYGIPGGGYGAQGWIYNNRLQLTTYSFNDSAAGAGTYSYSYSATANDGKLNSMTSPSGETVTYAYDSLQRLVSASAASFSQSFTYDGFGNLYKKTGTGAAAGWSWDFTSQLVSAKNQVGQYWHDPNGNAYPIGGSYDIENRLLSYSTGVDNYGMAYAPDNKRVVRAKTNALDELHFYVGNQRLSVCGTTVVSGQAVYNGCTEE